MKASLRRIFFSALLLFSVNSYGVNYDSFCENYEKVSGIVIPYMQNFWPAVVTTPSGPVPTVTIFTLTARSPIVDFCSYLTQMKHLSLTGKVFKAGEIANEMSGSQHSEKLEFARDSYDMGENINNVNKPGRKLDENSSFHRRVNSYLKQADKFFNGENANTFETKGEREGKMRSILRSSNRVALIKEASDCSTPQIEMEKSIEEEYKKEIYPLFRLLDEESDEVSYLTAQLQEMGVRLISDYKEHEEYQKLLYGIVNNAVIMERSPPKIKYIKVGGDKPPIAKTYYKYTYKSNQTQFREFRSKYEKKWNDFSYSLLKTRNIIKGKNYHAEQEFRNLSFECRRNKIEWAIRKQNPRFAGATSEDGEFSIEVDRKIQSCKESLKVNDEELSNLLSSYTELLMRALNNKIKLESKIWSFESEFQGINRNISEAKINTDIGDLNVNSITCDKKLNYGESLKLTTELQAISIEHRATMAEEMLKKTARKEEEARKEKEKEERELRFKKIIEETEKRRINVNDDMVRPKLEGVSF